MKVSNYHFSCCYANSGQFYCDRKKYFLRLLWAIFVPYFFSFTFVIMAWLRLSFTISFRSERKLSLKNCIVIEKVQTAYIACQFPLYPRSKHGLSKNTLIFPTFAVAQNLHFLYFYLYIVFDLNYFCNSYQVCSFLQVRLQRFSKKCPALNICA